MTRLSWGEVGDRLYEAGVDRGVYFSKTGPGVNWAGLVAVKDAPKSNAASFNYQDGKKYQTKEYLGSFAATIGAYTYPEEFDEADIVSFGFSYRTMQADDILGTEKGYKIHLVYNASAAPAETQFKTLDGSPSPLIFAWQVTTVPLAIADNRASAHIFVDSTKAYDWAIKGLEDILYGTEIAAPRMPSITEVLALFEDAAILQIVDNGDGSWTAYGPDDIVYMTDATSFEISYPSAVYIDTDTYELSSL